MLTNFDIFATAGGPDQAVVEPLPVTANAQGQLVISFSNGAASYPLVSGIELDSGGSIVQAINCGTLAGGTITINPTTFTNQGTLYCQHGETMDVTGSLTVTGQGPGFNVAPGGTLNINGNITVNGSGILSVGQISISGNLEGDLENADDATEANVTMDGNGSSTNSWR